jgi:hypothetical protein
MKDVTEQLVGSFNEFLAFARGRHCDQPGTERN